MDEQSKQEGGRLRAQAIPLRPQGAGLPGLISVNGCEGRFGKEVFDARPVRAA